MNTQDTYFKKKAVVVDLVEKLKAIPNAGRGRASSKIQEYRPISALRQPTARFLMVKSADNLIDGGINFIEPNSPENASLSSSSDEPSVGNKFCSNYGLEPKLIDGISTP